MCSYRTKTGLAILSFICVFAMFNCSENGTGPGDSEVATIDLDDTHQIIRGFGAAQIVKWRPELIMTAADADLAFGTDPGEIGFSILRIRIPWDSTTGSARSRPN